MGVEVKGSLLVDYVRLIRANKDMDWDKWLDADDKEALEEEIVTSKWYPYKLFRQLAWACYNEYAKSDNELAAVFGRFNMKNLLPVYRNVLVPGDPKESVVNFAKFWFNFFRGPGMESEFVGGDQHSATYYIKAPDEEKEPKSVEGFAHQLGGIILELVEQAGGIDPWVDVESNGLKQHITVNWD